MKNCPLNAEELELAIRIFEGELILATPTLVHSLDRRWFVAHKGRLYPTLHLTKTLKHLASQDAV